MTHQTISFIKSGIRLIGYAMLPADLFLAGFFLIVAELVGIYEEIGE